MVKKIIITSLICICLFACGKTNSAGTNAAPPEQLQEEEQWESIEVYGQVKPLETRTLCLDFSSKIKAIHVQNGQLVKKGDVIMVLDLDSVLLDLEEKRQNLATAVYDYQELKVEYENNSLLFNEQAISNKTLKDSQTALKKKESEVSILRRGLERLDKQLKTPWLEGDALVSPIDRGIITNLDSNPGEYLSGGSRVLSLINADTLVVEADVPEEFIKDVKLGNEALVIALADRTKEYQGRVSFIAQSAHKQGGETIVPVVISIEQNGNSLMPSFNVDIKIRKDNPLDNANLSDNHQENGATN